MAKVGSFGGVTFQVSTSKALTFSEFTRGGSSRWATHDINQKKPLPEFLGPGQESVSLKIILSAYYGINPSTELQKLRSFRDYGKVGSFILGTKSLSSSYWYIENISETNKTIDAKGRLLSIDASLTLKEYPKPPAKKKKKSKIKKMSIPKAKRKLGTITIKVGMLNCRSKPSLKGHIVKVLRKGQKYTVYSTKKTDINWYDMGGGKWCSAVSKYSSLRKA